MLLLLTVSIDRTADVLVALCGKRGLPVFRFNIDLWQSYRFIWTREGFDICDPTGRSLSSNEVTACLWRRPSLLYTPDWQGGTVDDRKATEAELSALVLEIGEWARATRRLRLIEPMATRRAGRLIQMTVAAEFFTVPEWIAGWGFRRPLGRRMVKRFAPEALGPARNQFIYVQSVDAERLSPDYPWITQDIGHGDRDATVLFVHGRCFGFEMEQTRDELAVEDWRTLIGSASDRWRPWALSPAVQQKIVAYMGRLGLRYGRLDFLVDENEATFLEVNPNGQFGWLDDPSGWHLHNAVLDAALDPSSTIRGDEAVAIKAVDGAHAPLGEIT